MKIPKVLTIAGLDSSGGAGISADLKTFTALDVYGAAIVTSITAQNTKKISLVSDVSPKVLSAQLNTVLSDIKFNAVKTGMFSSKETVLAVLKAVQKYKLKNIVVDPVMISSGGRKLLTLEARKCLIENLMPAAFLITPNISEAEIISKTKIKTIFDMKNACIRITDMGAKAVLIKGGHLEGSFCVDILYSKGKFYQFKSKRINTKNTHGTGCTFSAAIASFLAKGFDIVTAVKKAKKYLTKAIKHSFDIGSGNGPLNHFRKNY